MYTVVFTKSAQKDIDKIPAEIRDRVYGLLERIIIKPKKYARKLSGTEYYRLRVGDYRIIVHIDDKKRRIAVFKIDHRKRVYSNI